MSGLNQKAFLSIAPAMDIFKWLGTTKRSEKNSSQHHVTTMRGFALTVEMFGEVFAGAVDFEFRRIE